MHTLLGLDRYMGIILAFYEVLNSSMVSHLPDLPVLQHTTKSKNMVYYKWILILSDSYIFPHFETSLSKNSVPVILDNPQNILSSFYQK